MCKFFIDTEFHEYKKQPKVLGLNIGNPINTIELISIGIVSEDYQEKIPYGSDVETLNNSIKAKEYYAICKDFDLKAAWNNEWLRENVLKPICTEGTYKGMKKHYDGTGHDVIITFKQFKKYINKYGKTKKQIAEEILEFTDASKGSNIEEMMDLYYPKFYSYNGDYEWVVFCQLFGRKIDLPNGFPIFAFDIQQLIEDNSIDKEELIKRVPQEGVHHSLQDAIWNKKAFNYIQTIINEKRAN